MSDTKHEVGTINWADLTVDNADEVREFYSEVVGWKPVAFDMGGYNDYCMDTPAGEDGEKGKTVAGICWAKGGNAGLPAQWLIYINVADLDSSMERCTANGGEILAGPKSMDGSRYCVIRDPAGAVAALFEPKAGG